MSEEKEQRVKPSKNYHLYRLLKEKQMFGRLLFFCVNLIFWSGGDKKNEQNSARL